MRKHHHDFPRREFIALTGAIGSATIAGCVDESDDDPDNDDFVDDDSAAQTDDGVDDAEDDTNDDEPEFESFDVEVVTDGLQHPWGMVFLPNNGELLVSERNGRLGVIDIDSGDIDHIQGIPTVFSSGQGGLLDVAIHPDFDEEPWIYLTYAATNDSGESATHLGRGQLDRSAGNLVDFEVMYVVEPFVSGTSHYGSRIVFDDDGLLYMTSGDRGFKDFSDEHVSQDRSTAIGTTLRFQPDGSIPTDNPFTDDPDVLDEIYSFGHRNAQGMTVHPETGEIWQSEHGEQDGDEINIIEAGGNYGWPVAHYGCTYDTGEPVGDLPHERADIIDPVYYWECNSGGFPPAGMTVYDGSAFPGWDGDLFVGNLADQYLGRFSINGREVNEIEPLLEDREWRIRDVEVDPSTGYLYVAVDEMMGPIVRLVPA